MFAINDVGKLDDLFSNKFRVFDIISVGVDDIGNKYFVLWNGYFFKYLLFMSMVGVCCFEEKSLGVKVEYEIYDVG